MERIGATVVLSADLKITVAGWLDFEFVGGNGSVSTKDTYILDFTDLVENYNILNLEAMAIILQHSTILSLKKNI